MQADREIPPETPNQRMNAMAETIAAKTNVEKGAAQIKETAEKFGAATEQTTRMAEDSFASAAKGIKDYNLKALEFAQLNFESACDYTKRLLSAKSPTEIVELWSAYVRKQFEVLSDQTRELTMLGQRVASETAEPLSKQIH
jgi:phasin